MGLHNTIDAATFFTLFNPNQSLGCFGFYSLSVFSVSCVNVCHSLLFYKGITTKLIIMFQKRRDKTTFFTPPIHFLIFNNCVCVRTRAANVCYPSSPQCLYRCKNRKKGLPTHCWAALQRVYLVASHEGDAVKLSSD